MARQNNPKKLTFCGNIYHFRVFYLEGASPELKEPSIIMKIGFKFAKIEYFQTLQESVKNISLPFKYGSLKSPDSRLGHSQYRTEKRVPHRTE